MKKYKASVSQLSVDQITILEHTNYIAEIEEERSKLQEHIAELTSRIESLEGENVINVHQVCLDHLYAEHYFLVCLIDTFEVNLFKK
jgi:uncharacterized coiled-coil protein SlyX